MDRLDLKAQNRTILGKKVKKLRRDGLIPAHVFGHKITTEHISVNLADFLKTYREVGETGLINLKIGEDRIRPVLIRAVQLDPVRNEPLHIDFYQVNLKEKVTVPVPVVLIGEEPELVHMGEAVVIQSVNEVEVEALPADLPEKIKVDISGLKQIGEVILVSQMNIPAGVIVLADPATVVTKLDSAVTEEMKKLLEEQQVEAAAAAEAAAAETGAEAPASAETTAGEPAEGEETSSEGGEESKKEDQTEKKAAE